MTQTYNIGGSGGPVRGILRMIIAAAALIGGLLLMAASAAVAFFLILGIVIAPQFQAKPQSKPSQGDAKHGPIIDAHETPDGWSVDS